MFDQRALRGTRVHLSGRLNSRTYVKPIPAIACVDVGSEPGWAVVQGNSLSHGSSLEKLVQMISTVLTSRKKLALGFECPLYVPRKPLGYHGFQGRIGEGSYSWNGPVGLRVLGAGLVQVNQVLSQLPSIAQGTIGTTRWSDFEFGPANLLLWEAFVTSRSGAEVGLRSEWLVGLSQHEKDALAAAKLFELRAANETVRSELGDDAGLSLAGMQLLATGLSSDLSLLTETCLVIRTRKPS